VGLQGRWQRVGLLIREITHPALRAPLRGEDGASESPPRRGRGGSARSLAESKFLDPRAYPPRPAGTPPRRGRYIRIPSSEGQGWGCKGVGRVWVPAGRADPPRPAGTPPRRGPGIRIPSSEGQGWVCKDVGKEWVCRFARLPTPPYGHPSGEGTGHQNPLPGGAGVSLPRGNPVNGHCKSISLRERRY
jgi:hypothetical protein